MVWEESVLVPVLVLVLVLVVFFLVATAMLARCWACRATRPPDHQAISLLLLVQLGSGGGGIGEAGMAWLGIALAALAAPTTLFASRISHFTSLLRTTDDGLLLGTY